MRRISTVYPFPDAESNRLLFTHTIYKGNPAFERLWNEVENVCQGVAWES
jgi:hypothetical protein